MERFINEIESYLRVAISLTRLDEVVQARLHARGGFSSAKLFPQIFAVICLLIF